MSRHHIWSLTCVLRRPELARSARPRAQIAADRDEVCSYSANINLSLHVGPVASKELLGRDDIGFLHGILLARPTRAAPHDAGEFVCGISVQPLHVLMRWRRYVVAVASSLQRPRLDLDQLIRDLRFRRAVSALSSRGCATASVAPLMTHQLQPVVPAEIVIAELDAPAEGSHRVDLHLQAAGGIARLLRRCCHVQQLAHARVHLPDHVSIQGAA